MSSQQEAFQGGLKAGDRVRWYHPPLCEGTVLKNNGGLCKVRWDTGEVRRDTPDKLRPSDRPGDAVHTQVAELQEIADGAIGEGPRARGLARNELARLATQTAPTPLGLVTDNIASVAAREDEASPKVYGTFHCPLCQVSTPHHHTAEEIWAHGAVAREAAKAAVLRDEETPRYPDLPASPAPVTLSGHQSGAAPAGNLRPGLEEAHRLALEIVGRCADRFVAGAAEVAGRIGDRLADEPAPAGTGADGVERLRKTAQAILEDFKPLRYAPDSDRLLGEGLVEVPRQKLFALRAALDGASDQGKG